MQVAGELQIFGLLSMTPSVYCDVLLRLFGWHDRRIVALSHRAQQPATCRRGGGVVASTPPRDMRSNTMLQFLRSHLRWLAVPMAMILIASGLTLYLVRPSTARAATPSANVPVTLLLVHGFNDTCQSAFNQIDEVPNTGPNAITTISYLTQHGWSASNIDDLGYYSPQNTIQFQRYDHSTMYETDGTKSASVGLCDHNIYTWAQSVPNLTHTHNCPSWSAVTGYPNTDPVRSIGCELAWYVYENYTLLGLPVSILAHSMGGLVVRDAIGESGVNTWYPPTLDVRNVVTVATPHGGLYGSYLSNAQQNFPKYQEVSDMTLGSTFMNMMATSQFQSPRGKFGTHWTLMGADTPCNYLGTTTQQIECFTNLHEGYWPSGDGVVQGESMMAMNADFKVLYGVADYGLPTFPYIQHTGDSSTEYSHEANSCGTQTILNFIKKYGCLSYPFYLNDGTPNSQTVKAWVCTSNCNTNIADMSGDGNGTVYHSLAEIVTQLGPTSIPLYTKPLVLRLNATSNYVSAELGYTGSSYGMLRARSATQGSWETWTEAELPNGNIALLSNANNNFVSTELGYTGNTQNELRARSSTIGPWEIYQIKWLGTNTYALLSVVTGKYVSVALNDTGSDYAMLQASTTSIGQSETFTDSTGTVGCTNYGTLTIGPNGCSGFAVAGNAYPGTDHGWYAGGGVGLKGQEIWTYGNGTVQDSTATYSFTGLGTFYAYQIEAYIPNEHSDATHAHYHIHSAGGGDADQYINQENFTNQWDTSDLGFVCTSDGNATITLADNGGDNSPLMIGADAIQLVPTTHKCYFG
jgi:hypothetical protein